jgi:uncharacterized damage-inducible protein DinB
MPEHEHGGSSVLAALFKHNTWANLKMLEFCQALSDEQLDAAAIGGFGSIRDTLHHIVASEMSYVTRVNDKVPATPLVRETFPGFEALKRTVRWTGDELYQLALAARDDTLVRQRPPRMIIEYRLASLIVQAINHSTEHRAQISTIITQLGMEPPDMSGWRYMEEIGELQKF